MVDAPPADAAASATWRCPLACNTQSRPRSNIERALLPTLQAAWFLPNLFGRKISRQSYNHESRPSHWMAARLHLGAGSTRARCRELFLLMTCRRNSSHPNAPTIDRLERTE